MFAGSVRRCRGRAAAKSDRSFCPGPFGDDSCPGSTERPPGPRAPAYFGRAGRMAGDAVASNFARCPDSALTTCSRSRRSSCIRITRSSTFGTGERFGPRPRLEDGRLFCTMKYFHNWSDDNGGRDAIKKWLADCEIPGRSRQVRPRIKVSCKPYRCPARFRILSLLRCIRNFLNGM